MLQVKNGPTLKTFKINGFDDNIVASVADALIPFHLLVVVNSY